MIVWISGPTGSGKSTIVEKLQEKGWEVVREEIKPSTMQDFTKNPVQNCAKLQSEIMHSRHSQWSNGSLTGMVAFDRSIQEDHAVFCRLHYEKGYLSEDEFSELSDVAIKLQQAIPNPDLIVFLSAEIEVLHERLVRLGHPKAIRETLQRQSELYEEWLTKQTADVLRIDNSRCSKSVANILWS